MIREAEIKEIFELTQIAFSSKRYWNYPNKYFKIWERELTITEEYLKNNEVYVYEKNEIKYAFYSILELKSDMKYKNETLKAGIWLDHMFIIPQKIRKGIGKELFIDCVEKIKRKGCKRFRILADPNAKEFYLKQGCNYIKEFPSSIEGRTTPLLEFNVE